MLIVLGTATVLAEELRVIDDRGLLRAYTATTESMSVTITVVPEVPEENLILTLRQIDGLAEDISVQLQDQQCSAYYVTPGTWQIEGVRGKYIRSVELAPLASMALPYTDPS